MQSKVVRVISVTLLFLLVVSLAACSAPAPQAPQVVKETQVVRETQVVKETVVVAGTPQVVEKVVTATPPAQPTKSAGPKRGGTLNVILAEEPKGLYNHADSGTEGEYPLNQMLDGLVNADPERTIIPGLALSWDISPDGISYTFKLRQGVKFHDGSEFDADDVKWTFDEAIKPNSYSGAKYIPYIAGTEKIDKYTVKITLKQPWADFMPTLAYEEDLDIMAREAVEKWGVDYGFKAVVGTGSFKFDHWTRGQQGS